MYKVVINQCFGGFSISQEAIEWMANNGNETCKKAMVNGYTYTASHELERHDPLLVKCVEELGKIANGLCADLVIVETDSSKYYIEEYDGMETLHTSSNIEWTEINK